MKTSFLAGLILAELLSPHERKFYANKMAESPEKPKRHKKRPRHLVSKREQKKRDRIHRLSVNTRRKK